MALKSMSDCSSWDKMEALVAVSVSKGGARDHMTCFQELEWSMLCILRGQN